LSTASPLDRRQRAEGRTGRPSIFHRHAAPIRLPIVLSLLLCIVGLTLTAILAGGLIVRERALTRGTTAGLPGPIAHAGVALGLNVDLVGLPSAELEQALDQAQAVGATWVRQTFAWADIEPQPSQYRWAPWDQLVQAVKRHNLRLLAVLDTSPDWAQPPDRPHSRTTPPTFPGSFAAFARALAERYGNRIDAYQIWDEPNLASHWGGQPANPAEYAALLRAAAEAIRATRPDAIIVAAGLAPTIETGPENLSDVLYLRALYRTGAASAFDAVAGKPYGYDTGPDDRRADPDRLNFSRFVLLREEMERNGDGGKALWASHWGWNALPSGWTGPPSIWGQVSEAQQAEYTLRALERARLEWPWAGPLFLERLHGPAAPNDPRWGFALIAPDGRPRPVYTALQAQKSPPLAYPGWHPASDPAAQYTGGWRFSELGADVSQSGDRVTFTFRGTDLGLTVRRADYRAYLYVTIDGQPANALPRDDRGAYLVLTAPDPAHPGVDTLPVARGLPDGVHTAEIVAERGWGQWALVGFSVGRASTNLPSVPLVLLGLLGAAFAVGLVLSARQIARNAPGGILALSALRSTFYTAMAALSFYLTTWLTWGQGAESFYRRLGEGFQLGLTAAAVAIFYYSPWVVLNILSGLALALLIFLRLDLGLALVAFFAPFYLLPKPLWQWSFSMVEITLLVTFASWVVRIGWGAAGAHGRAPFPSALRLSSSLDGAVLGLVVVGAASALGAEFRSVAWREWRVVFLEPALFYLMLRATPLTRQSWWRLMDAFILSAVVVAAIGLVQYITGSNLITAEAGLERLRSVYGSPNNVGLYLGRALPILVAVGLMGRERARRGAYGVALVIVLAALVLSFSRGALFLGVPAGLVTVLLLWGGRRMLLPLGGAVVALVVGLLGLLRLPGLAERFSLGSATTFFRLNLWRSTLAMIRDHPLLGVGPDNFLYQYHGHYIRPEAWQEPSLSHPHNIVLDFWSRLGLLGLAVGLWLQVGFWRTGLRAWKGLSDPDGRALAAGLMGSVAAMLAHGLVDNSLFLVDLAYVFMLSLGAIQWLAGMVREHEWTTDNGC